jgi:hypothetical protein
MLNQSRTVLAKMSRGAELCRGCVGAWYLYRGTVRIARVASAVADEIIGSDSVCRVDDRTSVVGEAYAVSGVGRALHDAERLASYWQHMGNLASERGDRELAERHYARSQPHRDRMNLLLGNR